MCWIKNVLNRAFSSMFLLILQQGTQGKKQSFHFNFSPNFFLQKKEYSKLQEKLIFNMYPAPSEWSGRHWGGGDFHRFFF